MIEIRHAQLDDVGALHALGQGVSEFAVSDGTVGFWPEAVLRGAIDAPDVLVYVAEDKGMLVGFVIAGLNSGLRKATIENIFVALDYRGQEVGGQLLAALLASLQERGCEYVATLVPLDADRALQLYAKAGFAKGHTFLWLDKPLAKSFKL